ncbi:MAG: hypothetical protein LBK47_04120 [Prevotellaceae bacterium]|nr:hypothetical protein [Prevotellaceae bacterium]
MHLISFNLRAARAAPLLEVPPRAPLCCAVVRGSSMRPLVLRLGRWRFLHAPARAVPLLEVPPRAPSFLVRLVGMTALLIWRGVFSGGVTAAKYLFSLTAASSFRPERSAAEEPLLLRHCDLSACCPKV